MCLEQCFRRNIEYDRPERGEGRMVGRYSLLCGGKIVIMDALDQHTSVPGGTIVLSRFMTLRNKCDSSSLLRFILIPFKRKQSVDYRGLPATIITFKSPRCICSIRTLNSTVLHISCITKSETNEQDESVLWTERRADFFW